MACFAYLTFFSDENIKEIDNKFMFVLAVSETLRLHRLHEQKELSGSRLYGWLYAIKNRETFLGDR